jgi:hypothetical protein
MSKESLEHLRAVFGPAVFALEIEQVAEVLGKATRGAKGHIRDRIKRGDFPRARKDGGRWKIPLEEVAEVIEPTPTPMPAPTLPASGGGYTSRRRSVLGERISFIRSCEFWGLVCVALGWRVELEALNALANEARDELDALAVRSLNERYSERFPSATHTRGKAPL